MSPNRNRPVRYKPAATADLENIWTFTATKWSVQKADEYVAGIYAACERLAENPQIVRERDEFTPPVRVYNYVSHVIIFRDEGDHLLVIRVRHGVEDWTSRGSEICASNAKERLSPRQQRLLEEALAGQSLDTKGNLGDQFGLSVRSHRR